MTIKTRLNSLALAAAVLTSTALLIGGSASADNKHLGPATPTTGAILGITVPPGLGHGPVVLPKPPTQEGSGGTVVSCRIGKGCGHGPVEPPKPPTEGGSGGSVVSCQIGRGCTLTPPLGEDDDHHHHHDWYGHDHWFGWGRYRPEIVVDPAPVVAVPAPVEAVPAHAAAVAQVAQAPCNCLTKQILPDGSVLFQDICTKESAIAAPQTVGAH